MAEPADAAAADTAATPPLVDLAARVERVAAPLREQVLELLRREIMALRLRPGQRLVERELIEQIGVSRTTIREALRQLAAEGLVTTIPQRGAIVAAPSAKQAAEVYAVRALLEGLAAKECALNASDAQIERLRVAFQAVERSCDDPEPLPVLEAKGRFYEALFDGSGNATITSLLASLQARVAVLRATTISAAGRPKESVAEIRAIVDAVERRDADGAAAAASFHVRQAARTLSTQIGTTTGEEHEDA